MTQDAFFKYFLVYLFCRTGKFKSGWMSFLPESTAAGDSGALISPKYSDEASTGIVMSPAKCLSFLYR